MSYKSARSNNINNYNAGDEFYPSLYGLELKTEIFVKHQMEFTIPLGTIVKNMQSPLTGQSHHQERQHLPEDGYDGE